MALNLITNIETELTLSSQWGDLSTLLDQVKTGLGNKIRVHSLTNWDSSTTKPEIAGGSLFDVGGSLYLADADTALTDEATIADGTCHIKLIPSIDGLTVVPTLTNDDIPDWDETKHGWYDSADAFLPYEFEKASAVYSDKFEYSNKELTLTQYADGSIGNAPLADSSIFHEPSSTTGEVYSFFSEKIPEIGDRISVIGGMSSYTDDTISSISYYIFSYAERSTSSNILLYYSRGNANFDSGGSLTGGGTYMSYVTLPDGGTAAMSGGISIVTGNKIP